jgi:hypothetical protein
VRTGPGSFGAGEAAPVTQQELREAVSCAEQVRADVFAAAQQIADGFFLLRRDMNSRERTGAIEDGQLRGVTPGRS